MKMFVPGLLFVLMAMFTGKGLAADQIATVAPLLQAHAHNDYEHARPLLDALEEGFCSIEADVWLTNGQLLVAHDLADTKPGRTLQSLYLDPLHERIHQNGGHLYAKGISCTLLIDVKSAAEPTYASLRQVLQRYSDILTTFTSTNIATNALTVIISGNRAKEVMAAESLRYAAIDGRLTDLATGASTSLIPLISDNWKQNFKWRGTGPLSENERKKLRRIVQRAHDEGRRIRFWAAPDNPTGWRELTLAGVDLISTDDLAGLAKFLHAQTP